MNLMTLVRLVVLLVLGWIVVALGVGVLGVGTNETAGATFYIPTPSLVDTFTLGRLDHPSSVQHRLIDRSTGRVEPLSLPEDKAWSLLSVSPWRDQQGLSTAVGRWISRQEGQEAFCGLGLLKLPGGTLANCLSLEVLPTGKPCWVPGQTDEILFPAGDGQLYRCNIGGNAKDDGNDGSHGTSRGDGGNVVAPRVVTWDNKPPGSGRCVPLRPGLVGRASPPQSRLRGVERTKMPGNHTDEQRVQAMVAAHGRRRGIRSWPREG